MLRFIGGLIRPYRSTLAIIFVAMLIETFMSLAAPWPLKIILDNVVGDHKISPWLHRVLGHTLEGGNRLHTAFVAACLYVIISALGALASYIENYYTESAGQWNEYPVHLCSLGWDLLMAPSSRQTPSGTSGNSRRPGW